MKARHFIIIGILLLILVPAVTGAWEIKNPLKDMETIGDLINAVIDLVFWIAVTVAPIMIIIGGFMFITSAGNREKVTKAKKLMLYALIGLAITFLSRMIIDALQRLLHVE